MTGEQRMTAGMVMLNRLLFAKYANSFDKVIGLLWCALRPQCYFDI